MNKDKTNTEKHKTDVAFNTVLFDLDGTLLDTAPDFYQAINMLLIENKLATLDVKLKDFRPCVSEGVKYILERFIQINETDPKFQILLDKFLQIYYQIGHVNSRPYAGILTLLKLLQDNNITWGIVTNKPTWLTSSILQVKNYLQAAAIVVCGDTTNYTKPHPEPLLYACNKINVNPSRCIYIGDHERDILAGNAANMYTITALFGYIENQKEAQLWPAQYKVRNVPELSSWLAKLLLIR